MYIYYVNYYNVNVNPIIFHIVVWIGLRLALYLRLVVLSNFLLFPEPLAASLSVTFLSVYMCDTQALKEKIG